MERSAIDARGGFAERPFVCLLSRSFQLFAAKILLYRRSALIGQGASRAGVEPVASLLLTPLADPIEQGRELRRHEDHGVMA
jgi:hypothetical protein